jgi:hypothetical protein
LREFENRVLKSTFTPKREEVTGSLKELRIEDLYNLFCSHIS